MANGRADGFALHFRELTGNAPLSWQSRLYRDYFAKGECAFPDVIDLPTGLGKTMVMAIWLIARAHAHPVPTRLIYVVDRRTVVDLATDLAQMLVQRPIAAANLRRLPSRRIAMAADCISTASGINAGVRAGKEQCDEREQCEAFDL